MKLAKDNHLFDQLKSSLFVIEIISLITVVVWVSLSVYFSYSKTTARTSIASLIKSINPNLDQEVVAAYKQSRVTIPDTFEVVAVLDESEQGTPVRLTQGISTSPKPSPIATKSATASPSAQNAE